MGIWYCTREDVRRATESKTTARDDWRVDDAIEAGARNIDDLLHREHIAPTIATKYFAWPNDQRRSHVLWLDANPLISLTSLTAGGVAIDSDDWLLEPQQYGPPYDRIEVNLSSSAAFASGDTHQRAIAALGLWGLDDVSAAAGALDAALSDTTGTTVDVTNGAAVGVGSVLRCDDERMAVVGRQALDSGQNTTGALTAAANDTTVGVADGTAYFVDEVITVDAERMLVVDITGNSLIVKRAWDGTVLAAHNSGADVYASRRLTVERGVLGTTAATHSDAAALTVWKPQGLVHSLNVAEALEQLAQESAGYARTVGAGDSERNASAAGLARKRKDAVRAHGRKARMRSVGP